TAAGFEAVRAACPPGTALLPAEELSKEGWFPVTPLILQGRDVAPAAYVLPWAGKTVVFSGKAPILFDHDAAGRPLADLSRSRNDAADYLVSVQRLDGLNPSLWLPATPSDGQNAHLYEREWREIISANYQAAASVLKLFP